MYSRCKTPSAVMAAAILLNARNKQLCILQSLVGALLYTGQVSKPVNNCFFMHDAISNMNWDDLLICALFHNVGVYQAELT